MFDAVLLKNKKKSKENVVVWNSTANESLIFRKI